MNGPAEAVCFSSNGEAMLSHGGKLFNLNKSFRRHLISSQFSDGLMKRNSHPRMTVDFATDSLLCFDFVTTSDASFYYLLSCDQIPQFLVQLLFFVIDDGEVFIWDIKSRTCRHKFIDEGCTKGTGVCVSSGDLYVATG